MPFSFNSCGCLGQNVETRGPSRPSVGSCPFVVTLHGRAGGAEARRAIEEAVRRVPGLPGVVNKLIARLQ